MHTRRFHIRTFVRTRVRAYLQCRATARALAQGLPRHMGVMDSCQAALHADAGGSARLVGHLSAARDWPDAARPRALWRLPRPDDGALPRHRQDGRVPGGARAHTFQRSMRLVLTLALQMGTVSPSSWISRWEHSWNIP
eukprot:896743-Pleurochrysis_carterae.AAC.1